MSTLNLKYLPAEVLRRRAVKIKRVEPRLRRFADQMLEAMRQHKGVGLAANQVGSLERIAVIQTGDMASPLVIINPEITSREGHRPVTEGCLSIPGRYETITRAIRVKAKATDLRGKPITIKTTGLLAQALEHEIDHLNGVLFTDHLTRPRTPSPLDYL